MAKRPAKKDSTHLRSRTDSGSFIEGAAEAAKRQQQDGLIQEQEELSSDKSPTVIPFPSEEAPAAADRPDAQSTHDIQDGAGHASAAQRLWVFRARQIVAKRKRAKRWDWSRFKNVREKSPEERLERAIVRYRREKQLRGQQAQLPAPAATIIPFPSEQAQAAGGSDDPPDDT